MFPLVHAPILGYEEKEVLLPAVTVIFKEMVFIDRGIRKILLSKKNKKKKL